MHFDWNVLRVLAFSVNGIFGVNMIKEKRLANENVAEKDWEW